MVGGCWLGGPPASDLLGRRGRASTTVPSGARLREIRGEVSTDWGRQPGGGPSKKMKPLQRTQTSLRQAPRSARAELTEKDESGWTATAAAIAQGQVHSPRGVALLANLSFV